MSLRPSVEPFAASDGHLYLLDGGSSARFVLRDAGPLERRLLAALDGAAPTVDALCRHLRAPRAQVTAALDQLAALGLLQEHDAGARDERFDRQLAWLDDRFATRGEALAAQARLGRTKVAVLGCGGLGCWTLAALACTGIGAYVLVDDDTVELSNLNRQLLFAAADVGRLKVHAAAEALRRFDPAVTVDARPLRLGSREDVAAAIAGCDLVVETADRPMYELPRWVDDACRSAGLPHISAAQHPPQVRIGPLRIPGRSACLECIEAAHRARYPLYDEVAAFRASRERPTPTLGTASGLIGTLVATEILHLITGAHPPATLNRSLIVDLATLASRFEPEPLVACEH